MMSLTVERLRQIVNYDPSAGVFTWVAPLKHKSRTGKIAGRAGQIKPSGYQSAGRIKIAGQSYKKPRLAWFYVMGEWPVGEIDHRDGNTQNDAFDNLREATRAQNNRNRKPQKGKACRLKGVSFKRNGYEANICVGGKGQYLGRFKTEEAAHAAYCAESKRLHGEFARTA